MKKYEKPCITLIGIDIELFQYSEMGPGAGDIGSPNINGKSVWNEKSEETHH